MGSLAIGAVCFMIYKWKHQVKVLQHIPSSKKQYHWFLGNAFELENPLNMHKVVAQWSKDLGPVFAFRVLYMWTLIITDPQLIREILLKQDSYREGHTFERSSKIHDMHATTLLPGILNSRNEDWKWRRDILVSQFAQSKVMKILPQFVNEAAQNFVEKLKCNLPFLLFQPFSSRRSISANRSNTHQIHRKHYKLLHLWQRNRL